MAEGQKPSRLENWVPLGAETLEAPEEAQPRGLGWGGDTWQMTTHVYDTYEGCSGSWLGSEEAEGTHRAH